MDCEMKESELLFGCMEQKMKVESGTVVVSYGWKNATVKLLMMVMKNI